MRIPIQRRCLKRYWEFLSPVIKLISEGLTIIPIAGVVANRRGENSLRHFFEKNATNILLLRSPPTRLWVLMYWYMYCEWVTSEICLNADGNNWDTNVLLIFVYREIALKISCPLLKRITCFSPSELQELSMKSRCFFSCQALSRDMFKNDVLCRNFDFGSPYPTTFRNFRFFEPKSHQISNLAFWITNLVMISFNKQFKCVLYVPVNLKWYLVGLSSLIV